MGLKFRRGTTAQKSGSLAFGEPYVNTDLGTLQVGGTAGDITLGASGTGSQGSFAGISGSSLDITGNAKIDGNLTLGGAITIGDASADTVNVIASLSSSLIPQTTNVFDLGSATKIWKDLYISTGSIKFVEGTTVVKTLNAATLTSLEAATGSSNIAVTNINSYTSSQDTKNSTLATTTGSLITSQSNATIAITNINSYTSSLKSALSVTGSNLTVYGNLNIEGTTTTISASNLSIVDNLIYLNDGSNLTNPDLGWTGNYNDGTYRHAGMFRDASDSGIFKIFKNYTPEPSQSIDTAHGTFALADLSVGTLYGSIASTNGVVSGSSQITYTSISSIPAGIVSGSSQITYTSISSIPAGIVSGSAQITYTSISSIPAGIVSGSAQVTLSSTTGYGTVINQNLLTTSDVRHNSLGVGMAASATAGRIDASGDIVAFSTSDKNFKENITPIENPIEKIRMISGNTYDWKADMKEFHGFEGNDVGVIAQEIEAVLPQLVTTRETGYKAVKYDKLVALLIEGIKAQQNQIDNLTIEIEKLKESKGL